jgi:hypothetical protein
MVEGRHEVCGDLCRFLFGYGVGRILFTCSKMYSSVPPCLAAPRYRNNSIDMAEESAKGLSGM